ncbi:MAG: hypothetical protein FJZ96_01790 [Chloroflexi bacterium]|nr:hypothetical protein [Chloroflexota bacterium]
MPTETLIPALPANEAEDRVIELLSNNGGCRLPCIWGFTPGETSARMVWSSLHAFGPLLSDVLFGEIGGGASINIPRDNIFIITDFTVEGTRIVVPSGIVRWVHMSMLIYRIVNLADGYTYEYLYDSPYYAQYFQYYTLPYLLSNYGPPEDISIELWVGFDIGGGDDEFILYLDYISSGWIAPINIPVSQKNGYWVGCPGEAFTSLRAWSPGDTATADEYLQYRNSFSGSSLFRLPVEEALSMTIDEFYQQFKDPSNTQCLEIPIDLVEPNP